MDLPGGPDDSTQIGANGRVPATHSCGAPVTYRTLAWRPEHQHVEVVGLHLRQRALAPPGAQRQVVGQDLSAHAVVSVRCVGVVGDGLIAVLGDDHDLLAAVAAGAVLPDDGLEHEHHARREDEVVVELLAQIRSDHRHFGGVGADAVAQVEVRQPRLRAAVGGDGRAREVTARGARPW